VLFNVLHNAVQFTDEGDIRISAKQLSRTHDRVQLELQVSDDGVGIAPDMHRAIFGCGRSKDLIKSGSSSQPCFELSATAGGAGLGLYISEQLVTLLGGTISVESTVGVGTTFTVRLSLQVHHESISPRPDEAPKKPPPLCHFLLVEDNPLNIKVCSTLLAKMGHSVTVAENGLLAVEAVAKGLDEQGRHAFDMALMDCEMPIMDGFEATRQIREMERKRSVQAQLPIVALSVRPPSAAPQAQPVAPLKPSLPAAVCDELSCVPCLLVVAGARDGVGAGAMPTCRDE
jgi:CheY-like chemotaxis protein